MNLAKIFYFRVENSTYLSCHIDLEAVKADDTLITVEHGFNACLNHFSRVLFINGLQAGVKPISEAKFWQLQDTKSLLAAVVEAEVSAVHALELEISTLQKQAKSWQSGTSSGTGAGLKAARSQVPKPSPSGAPLGLSYCQKVVVRTKLINCFKGTNSGGNIGRTSVA